MASRMIFTWNLTPESFDEIWRQSNLLDLRNEFEMRNRPLSQSLLIWHTSEETRWLLADFENQKIYHIHNKENNPEIEVSEATWDTEILTSRFNDEVYGTNEGFVDWLKLFTPVESDLEKLKRTDLSERKLDFEIVNDDLLVAYEMLREILTSPREWLIPLSSDNIQQIRTYLERLYMITRRIWSINLHSTKGTYMEVVQQTFQFCNEVKRKLGPTVAYLTAKRAEQFASQATEQLETQIKTTVADAVEKLKEVTDESQKTHEEAEQNETTRQKEFAELKNKFEDELARETVSKHREIFAKQADEHRRVSQRWLIAIGILSVIFGIVFYWLFEALRLGGTEWVGVLQNVFTKGFLLTLTYFILNRFNKNYTAQKHLEVVNRHRQNALDTFDDFFESAGDNPETRHAVLVAATDAIFDANQSGYLSAKTKGSDSANPIQQVVRTAFPSSSSTRSED